MEIISILINNQELLVLGMNSLFHPSEFSGFFRCCLTYFLFICLFFSSFFFRPVSTDGVVLDFPVMEFHITNNINFYEKDSPSVQKVISPFSFLCFLTFLCRFLFWTILVIILLMLQPLPILQHLRACSLKL